MQKKVARLANGNKISWKVPLDWQVSPQKTWPAPARKETLMARGVRDAKKLAAHRLSRAVPHLSTTRALSHLTSEFGWDPVHLA